MAAAADEWLSSVEEILEKAKHDVADGGISMRVPEAMVNTKVEAYIPQLVSLGPYHHVWAKDKPLEPSNQRPTHLSQLELQKLKKATERAPEIIKRLFTKISEAPIISEFEQIYHRKIEEENIPEFAWMMTVDALFLHNFLLEINSDNIMPAKASIMCDIVKLENQIPLSLLLQVETTLKTSEQAVRTTPQRTTAGENAPERTIVSLIESKIKSLCCFDVSDKKFNAEKEKHLLDHLHQRVSSILQVETQVENGKQTWRQWVLSGIENTVAVVLGAFKMHPARRDHPDFLPKYNAKELVNGGIKFKEFKGPGKIRFCRNSDTLYLPQITISDTYTEVLLRNLLALEFNDADREKRVMYYVELMDCLIDTPEDVSLLRESHIINRQSMMITDEYVSKMWDGMSKPLYLTGFLDVGAGLKAQIREALIKNYYNSKIRRWWDELLTNYLSSPWKFVALLIGFFVLVLTVVQTYCTVTECGGEHPEKERSEGKRFNRFG
ncbi:hypothetical protein SUGI_0436570 [Cryptomeria japonica]|uniref:putative UPF0481 protein At3g02645 n=1 Tax=Cryptomeria japonica TaxID=3369 RepID=UPI002408A671|nr:putative UPF0481 protein At3g02645 [Cryptomeria japonica]GLJ23138.1 hypothetical protein SUGI_0436570 [Cryptomeria japonica]